MEEDYKKIFRKHFDEHLDDTDAEKMYQAIKVRGGRRRGGRRRRKKSLIIIIPILIGLGVFVGKTIKKAQENRSNKLASNSAQFKNELSKDNASESQELMQAKTESNDVQSANKNLTEVKKDSKSKELKQFDRSINKEKGASKAIVKSTDEQRSVIDEALIASANVETGVGNNGGAIGEQVYVDDQLNVDEKNVVNENSLNNNDKGKSNSDVGEEKETAMLDHKSDIVKVSQLDVLASSISCEAREVMPLQMKANSLITTRNDHEDTFQKSLSLQAGSTYGLFRNTYASSDQAMANYITERARSESALEAISGSLLLNYRLHKNISFSSGVAYTRINELFQGQDSFVETRTGEHVIGVEEYPNGVKEFTYSTGEYEALVETSYKVYNKTDLLYIPLYLNIHKSVGNFNLSMFGGVKANIVTNESGYIFNNDLNVASLNEAMASRFKLGLNGGVGVEYSLSEKLGAIVNVGYSRLAKEQLEVDVKYDMLDLGLALNYSF